MADFVGVLALAIAAALLILTFDRRCWLADWPGLPRHVHLLLYGLITPSESGWMLPQPSRPPRGRNLRHLGLRPPFRIVPRRTGAWFAAVILLVLAALAVPPTFARAASIHTLNNTTDQATVTQFATFFFILMVVAAGAIFMWAGFKNQSGMK